MPARDTARRKVVSCRLGVHAATTTRSRPSSRTSFSIEVCPSSEHMNGRFRATTTSSWAPTWSVTSWTSTTSLMLPPQWQT